MAVRTINGVRVRARHHQHFDGRASVTLSWTADRCKVSVDLRYPAGKTECEFETDFQAGKYDEQLAEVTTTLEGFQ